MANNDWTRGIIPNQSITDYCELWDIRYKCNDASVTWVNLIKQNASLRVLKYILPVSMFILPVLMFISPVLMFTLPVLMFISPVLMFILPVLTEQWREQVNLTWDDDEVCVVVDHHT
jgi:hypothetical protein